MSPRLLLSLTALLAASHSYAKEYPIGEPQQCAGMEVGAVYLQPISMDPPGMMRAAADMVGTAVVSPWSYERAVLGRPWGSDDTWV